jgi:hypothetical protein
VAKQKAFAGDEQKIEQEAGFAFKRGRELIPIVNREEK